MNKYIHSSTSINETLEVASNRIIKLMRLVDVCHQETSNRPDIDHTAEIKLFDLIIDAATHVYRYRDNPYNIHEGVVPFSTFVDLFDYRLTFKEKFLEISPRFFAEHYEEIDNAFDDLNEIIHGLHENGIIVLMEYLFQERLQYLRGMRYQASKELEKEAEKQKRREERRAKREAKKQKAAEESAKTAAEEGETK